MSFQKLITANGVSWGYGARTVVNGADFSLSSGDLLAVVGHNGAGKSSLLKLLLGLLPSRSGALRWHEKYRFGDIAYLGQRQDLDRTFPMKAYDLVASGGWNLSVFDVGGPAADTLHRRTMAALARVGLIDAMALPLHALSGGQLQRALFGRAVVQNASIVILDEPFAGVDQKTEGDLLAVIMEWTREGKAVVLVSHDLSSVLDCATSVLLLGNGRARFGPPDTVLTNENLADQAYMSPGEAEWLAGLFSGSARNV